MPTMNELIAASEHTKLMLKMRQVLIFFVPTRVGQTPGAEITALTDASGAFLEIPAEYQAGAVGLIDKGAGVEFPREVSTQEATSHNHGGPTRTDTDEDTKSVRFTAQETRRAVLEMAYGLDLAGVTMAANGEVIIDHPDLPDDLEGRLLVIGYDPKYQVAMGKWFPRFQPKEFPTVSWKRDELVQYEINGDALYDEDFGTAVREFAIAGPGALAMALDFGFTLESTPWEATTAYDLNDRVTLTGEEVLRATTAGTSSATEPTAPATVGGTVTDGTVVWTRIS